MMLSPHFSAAEMCRTSQPFRNEPGPEATAGLKLFEAVPCDELVDVLEGLVRYGVFDKVRAQLHRNAVDAAGALCRCGPRLVA